jgi:hypothetical protein
MSSRQSRQAVKRVINDMLTENKEMSIETAFELVVNMVTDNAEIQHTYAKQLKDAEVTASLLKDFFKEEYLSYAGILIKGKIPPLLALNIIENSSKEEMFKFKYFMANWPTQLANIVASLMIDHLNAEDILKHILDTIDGASDFPLTQELKASLNSLASDIRDNLHGITPAEYITQIFDDEFIKSCDKLALTIADARAGEIVTSQILTQAELTLEQRKRTHARDKDQLFVEKMQLVYEKGFAGRTFIAAPAQSVKTLCRPTTRLAASIGMDNVDMAGLGLGFIFGALFIPPLVNFVSCQSSNIFSFFCCNKSKRKNVMPKAEEELRLLTSSP